MNEYSLAKVQTIDLQNFICAMPLLHYEQQ